MPDNLIPYMNCLNEFRRFETMFEGLRYFDLKRWGVNWKHEIGVSASVTQLETNDPRKAIEVPWEAISAGMASSRPAVSSASGANELVLFTDEDFKIK